MEELKQSSVHTNEFDDENRDVPCSCNEKRFSGHICECTSIKEDIRTLFSLEELFDKLITGQKKALQTPLEQAKPYKLLDIVFDMNVKFGACCCEQNEESINSENGHLAMKIELQRCLCSDLPKKRCVLRLIRNYIFQRMKLVKKLNFLLLEKNKKIKEMIKKKEKSDDPCSPYITKSISYEESIHKLIERYNLLKEMKEEDLPKGCLFDKKELMKRIGHHRILTKPLRHIYFLEELAYKVRKNTQSYSDFKKGCPLDESFEEKEECRCSEINKKITFIKNFKTMIARLNPITHKEEEMLDFSKQKEKTLEQLIKEKRTEDLQKLIDLVRTRNEGVQFLMEQKKQIEDDHIVTDVIILLNAYIKQIEAELELLKPDQDSKRVDKLISEKQELLDLIVLLITYRNTIEKPSDFDLPYKKSLLEEINAKLQDYLDSQKKYFDEMEKLLPGFKIAIFDEELEKDRVVAEICRDDNEKMNVSWKEGEGSELEEGRERLRALLKGLSKPHLHIIDSPFESKKPLISKLEKFQKNINDKLYGEIEESQFEILEKELLDEIADNVPPLPKNEPDCRPNYSSGEKILTKLKEMAFEEGRKIVSYPDPLIQRQENLMLRKRLVQELGLKCQRGGGCCTEVPGSSKAMLKAAYETERRRRCDCTDRLEQLHRLEMDFENIIFEPEKHHIDYVEGPLNLVNTRAIKRMRKFIHKHATKKIEPTNSDTDFISSLSKRKLVTVYDEERLSVVWKDFKRSGLLSINLEAQMMTNERIIIRPQYKKRVKVLSGGRIGLDPLYSEYVCLGMLDGVVLGNERHGPIPRTILQAIKELDSGEGVVIIILNEPEERFSFLFAIERARKLGIDAELVLARDDVSDSQPEKWRYGPRGHCGIILQFKVAAGMAAKGRNLAEISRVTQGIHIATLDCRLTKFGPNIGSGIRDEKGYCIPGLQSEDVLNEMLNQLIGASGDQSVVPEPDTKMILLLNKFMLTSDDVYSIISFLSKKILETGAKVGRAYHGNFSAFTKQGFSITVAKDWNDELLEYLDHPTTCVHWPSHLSGSRHFVMTRTRLHRDHIVGALVPPESVGIVFEILDRTLREIAFSLDRILECCRSIGVPLMNVVWSLKPNLRRLPLGRPYLFLCLVGKVLFVNLPSVGKYFQLILVSAAQEFMKDPDFVVGWMNWCKALLKGIQSFAGYTKFKVGDGTIMDYLSPIAESISKIKEGWSPLPFLYGGIEQVNCIEAQRKDDLGILVLGQLFRNMYSCLNECLGHYPGEAWWKMRPSPNILLVNELCKEEICPDAIPENLKEQIKEKEKKWVEYSRFVSLVYSEDDDKDSEPSIEAVSLEEVEGDGISARSAAGVLYEQLLSKQQENEQIGEEITSLSGGVSDSLK